MGQVSFSSDCSKSLLGSSKWEDFQCETLPEDTELKAFVLSLWLPSGVSPWQPAKGIESEMKWLYLNQLHLLSKEQEDTSQSSIQLRSATEATGCLDPFV